jgi:hypothetical protein
LIELKNNNTFYNTKILSISNQQPSRISSRSSSSHVGAKINNTGFVDKKHCPQKTSSSARTQAEVQVHMLGKNKQHWNTENDAIH